MKKQLIAAIATSLFSTHVFAHPEHGLVNAYAGFMHPLMGLDHLLMMLAVGFWAAKLTGRLRWQLPMAFIGFMAVGAALGLMGFAVAGVETAIAASMMVMAVLLAMRLPISPIGRIGIIAIFATLHGLAHGLELGPTQHTLLQASGVQTVGVLFGILVATALLHGLGFVAGIQRHLVTKRVNTAFALVMFFAGGFLLLN
jgi:urease accessory protein